MKINVEIARESQDREQRSFLNEEFIAEITERVLSRYPAFAQSGEFELSILLTDNSKMKSLNKEFREKDKATNVLSFPDEDLDWRNIDKINKADKTHLDSSEVFLGDVAFGYQIISEEAQEKSISFQDHFTHLLIHAILHLIGYDHIEDEDAKAMETLETELLQSLNIASPY
ncbi:MAG: rRNA maturation RNase YbeY [Rickettsiales bacterium]|nr:MAG: rRNA maturation RNase YbeY [Rickettsiales bacterium]